MSKKRKHLPEWLTGVEVKKTSKPCRTTQTDDEIQAQPETELPVPVSEVCGSHGDNGNHTKTDVQLSVSKTAEKSEYPLTESSTSSKGFHQAARNPVLPKTCKTNQTQKYDPETREKISQVKQEQKAQFDNMIEMTLPLLQYSGSTIYSYQKDDCSLLSEDIHQSFTAVDGGFMGFDMEWPVTYQAGKQSKVALIQLCTSDERCYLFQISCMGEIPKALKNLLVDHKIKKVGVGIESDLWKLERDYDISVKSVVQQSMVDIGKLANKKLKSAENWSLDGLTKNILRSRISKDPEVRTSDWSRYPLTDIQKTYAATDAYVSYKIYEKLVK